VNFVTKLKNQDWLITIVAVLLAVLSLILIFSTTFNASNPLEGENTVARQIVFFIVGFIIYFVISATDIAWIKQPGFVLAVFIGILLSLLFLLTFGQEIQNTQRWIPLGPFSFQPAEFAKLALVIVTAFIFSNVSNTEKIFHKLLLAGSACAIYIILIVIQPALGNALIALMIWGVVMYSATPLTRKAAISITLGIVSMLAYFSLGPFSGVAASSFLDENLWKLFVLISTAFIFTALFFLQKFNLVLLIVIFLVVLVSGPVLEYSWNNLIKDYQKDRIESFAGQFNSDPLNKDYQVRQSIAAIGSGRLWGRGYMQGSQSSLKVLPFAHTDFIFAAHAEQFGFLGVIILLILYGVLIYRCGSIYLNSSDRFSKLVVVGVIAIILTNIYINISMNMGLIPVTGVPLPLVSYGGSSVILILLCLGLVQSVRISTKPRELVRKFDWKVDL